MKHLGALLAVFVAGGITFALYQGVSWSVVIGAALLVAVAVLLVKHRRAGAERARTQDPS